MAKVLRKSAVATAAVLVSSFGLAQPATVSAAVTATTISTVTGVPPGYTIENENIPLASQPTVTVTGTATAAVGDQVDVRCYFTDDNYGAYDDLQEDVPVTSGTWTATGPLSDIAGDSCRFVAMPADVHLALNDPAAASFGRSRQLLTVGRADTSTTTDGMGHTTEYDDDVSVLSGKADNRIFAVSGCGAYSRLLTSAPHVGGYLWDCMVSLFTDDDGSDGAAQPADPVRIGGHSAHTGIGLHDDPDLPLSQGDLRYSYSQNKSTGDAVVNEVDPYYFCWTGPNTIDDSVTPTDCTSWQYSGVTLHRTYGFTQGGQVIVVTDRFVSTVKTRQTLSLEYENDLYLDQSTMRLPGDSQYESRTLQAINTSSWPADGALYVRDDPSVPNGSIDAPLGSETWSTRPTSAYLFSPDEFFLNYTRRIPAGGSFTLTHRLAMTANTSALTSLSAANRKANVPRLKLRHLPAKTAKRALTVRGAVVNGGNGPITKVVATVGHHHYKAVVTRAGKFTLHVRLKRGVDHITVVGIDPAHQKATAKATIRYKPRKR